MSQALFILAAFLVGSLPFSYWVAQRLTGEDLRQIGSRNPGATNVLRIAGRWPAAAALTLDVAKGAVPVALAREIGADELTLATVALASVCGHIFSPFLGFRGGKGVATTLGTLTVLQPVAALAGLAVFAVVVAWKRFVSLGSVLAAAAVAVAVALGGAMGPGQGRLASPVDVAVLLMAAMIVGRHLPNIYRLATGQEAKLGEKARES